jgi:tRNA-specific 2-thiouridylase
MEYRTGRTPNPCVLCNQSIKFGILPSLLAESGITFDRYATGHYARIEYDETSGRYLLKKALDPQKDQSYFLYRLTQEQLSKALFPLGEYEKNKVRQIALDAKLPVHDKEESQDFYSGDYTELLDTKVSEGNIVNTEGKILGKHKGIWNYTVGQRKGLGIFHKNPVYVISINKDKNEIVIGEKEHLFSKGLTANNITMIVKEIPQKAQAKIRSNSKEVPCTISCKKDELKVIFDEPQSAVTPGQSVVLYSDDIVLGGGIIEKAITL